MEIGHEYKNIDLEQLKRCSSLPRSLTFFLDVLEDNCIYGIDDVKSWEYDKDTDTEVATAFATLEELEQQYPGKMIDVCERIVRKAMEVMNPEQWIYSVYILGVEIKDKMLYEC